MIDLSSIVKTIFYQSDQPLLFTHLFFWIFFLVVLLGYSLVFRLQGKRNYLKVLYLLLVSFYFYYKTSGIFIILLWYVIVIDFFLGKKIAISQEWKRKLWLTISIIN
ncbi:MAG: hypothetical protein N2203_02360, partial [Bacteroidia bacterium]|nr:hypothetical protein [Bacteroidia bacterium]